MKTWTVVVEITDENESLLQMPKEEIEALCTPGEYFACPDNVKFRIMETIPAPYGPQHPDGVFIAGKDGKPA
jgi:hypothetical protein